MQPKIDDILLADLLTPQRNDTYVSHFVDGPAARGNAAIAVTYDTIQNGGWRMVATVGERPKVAVTATPYDNEIQTKYVAYHLDEMTLIDHGGYGPPVWSCVWRCNK